MITQFKKQIEPIIAIIAQPFLSWNPHLLTSVSVIFALIFAVSMSYHNFVLAGLSWLGIIFDALDGYVARKSHKVSDFGAFFDSTVDRLSDFFYICAFGFGGFISWPIIAFALVTTFLISYTKARGEGILPKHIILQEGIMQRSERLGMLFFIFLLVVSSFEKFAIILFVLFILLNSLTVVQRVIVIKRLL